MVPKTDSWPGRGQADRSEEKLFARKAAEMDSLSGMNAGRMHG
jgi:hypothetical protein